jgi:hypothetical protein
MKRFLFLLPLLVCCWAAEAKIWRVNNNAGVAADFTSVDAAVNHSSVVNGDTIHVEPTAVCSTIQKPVIFIQLRFVPEARDQNSMVSASLSMAQFFGTILAVHPSTCFLKNVIFRPVIYLPILRY